LAGVEQKKLTVQPFDILTVKVDLDHSPVVSHASK
jgi:hypothetical protein